jgi:UDP-hydrolysing UDP-N-acetyl-D-glucosamine 2-epimerase
VKRKVCVVIGSRANYSSIRSAMTAIAEHAELELQVVAGASAVLDRYGTVTDLVERDGFEIAARVFMLIEGETLATMAKSTGLGLLELPTVFDRLKPDIVLTVGDRFETMATTLSAAYMNIPIAHTMGGEVSGTIDESIRHAVTKFAHIHFPASSDARDRIVQLGERPQDVYLVGCPRIDLVSNMLAAGAGDSLAGLFEQGVGDPIDLDGKFLLVSQHPVTTEYGEGGAQITTTLEAVRATGLPAIVLWPNADAGSEDISRGIRKWRERGLGKNMHFFKNLPTATYIHLMARTACLVGNSSSGVREGAYIGTPVINIGTRQVGRRRGHNVVDTSHELDAVSRGLARQIEHGRYTSDPIYGDGSAGARIADVLATKSDIQIQKRITY